MSSESMQDLLIKRLKQPCIFSSLCIRKSRISSYMLVTQWIECPTEYFLIHSPSIMLLETFNLPPFDVALDRTEETSYVHHESWFVHHLAHCHNLVQYHTAEFEGMNLDKSSYFVSELALTGYNDLGTRKESRKNGLGLGFHAHDGGASSNPSLLELKLVPRPMESTSNFFFCS